MNSPRTTHTIIRRQRGAAFMVMLVIMIIGVAAIFVASLKSSAIQIAQNQNTSDSLARAKEALIAYAGRDPNRPGELPCPDFNNDGFSDINDYNGSNCKSLTGWLPWKTLGLPELRDANGEHLWYTVADPFHANGSVALNSDTPFNPTYSTSMLTVIDGVTAATLETNVIAIIFSPGAVISAETRSTTDSNASTMASNYLEGKNANPNTSAIPNTTFQTANDKSTPLPTPVVNDRLLTINYTSLFPAVEMRIGREAKSCLDNYALSSGNKYPWALSVINPLNTSYFGRIPASPVITSDPNIINFVSALSNLQSALANYSANNNSTTRTALYNAGVTLEQIAGAVGSHQPTVPSISGNTALSANNTGDKAQDLAQNPPQTTLQTVQGLFAQTLTYFQADNGGMYPIWPSGCMFNATYWPAWQSEVFYQVSQGFQPGSGGTSCGPNCISINGIAPATYRAAVVIARQPILISGTLQNPTLTNDTSYLETNTLGTNQHQTTSSTNFVTYSPSSPYYTTVNDLVLCLDGNYYCK